MLICFASDEIGQPYVYKLDYNNQTFGVLMKKKRVFTAEQKITILREHLENRMSVSKLAEQHNISPVIIYQWKKQLFEGALQTFSPVKNKHDARKIKTLENKLQEKDSLISEIVSENITYKKKLNGDS